MHHDVVQIHDHFWDASQNGGHDLLEAAGGRAEAKGNVGVMEDPHVGHKGSEVAAALM